MASLEIVLGHAVPQRVSCDFQKAARLRDIAAGLLQGFLQHGLFDFFHRKPEREQ